MKQLDLARYNKLWVALVLGVVAVLDSYLGPGNEVSRVVLSLATVVGVYAAPNKT